MPSKSAFPAPSRPISSSGRWPLREVSAIVDEKAPDDAADFKAWLRGIGQMVAEASLEGGFLGIGGVRVSEAEKATLADIERALSAPA
jgi:hypothetical protein